MAVKHWQVKQKFRNFRSLRQVHLFLDLVKEAPRNVVNESSYFEPKEEALKSKMIRSRLSKLEFQATNKNNEKEYLQCISPLNEVSADRILLCGSTTSTTTPPTVSDRLSH